MRETLLEGNLKIERAVEGLRKQSVRRLSEHGHKQNALSSSLNMSMDVLILIVHRRLRDVTINPMMSIING